MQRVDGLLGRAKAGLGLRGIDQHEVAVRARRAHVGKQFIAPMHRLGTATRLGVERRAELVEHAGQLAALTIVEFAGQATAESIEQSRQTCVAR